jgi:hypothetical protein
MTQRLPIARAQYARAITAAVLLALLCAAGRAQNPPAQHAPVQAAGAAPLNDALLAKATALYDSTAKSGLHGFDCALHPDWNKVMSSARKGAAVADDDPKLVLMRQVKITLHARLSGNSTLDWQRPEHLQKPLDASETAMLEEAHRGLEQSLLGTLKLWTPLIDGSVAESLGEDDVDLTQTSEGYTLRSRDKQHALTEVFDSDLLLKHFITVDAGSTVDIEPAFQPPAQPSGRGLALSGFVAHLQPAGVPGQGQQDMRVGIEYQTVSAMQIPARVTIDLPNVVEMDFSLDGCTVNPASK